MKRRFSPRNTKAVFFDMNNTLVDPKTSFDRCFVNVLVDFAGRWDDGEGGWNPRSVLAAYKAEWNRKTARMSRNSQEIEKAKKQCLAAALRDYPFQVNDAFVRSFFREMRSQMREHAALFPHALDTVAKLSASYKIGIITNGNKERQEEVLRRLQLAEFVPGERLFASNKCGARKPDPAIFQAAVRGLEVRPAEAVMVGDSWKNDVTGALNSGMNAVWVNRTNAGKMSRRKAGKLDVPVVAGMRELAELFEP